MLLLLTATETSTAPVPKPGTKAAMFVFDHEVTVAGVDPKEMVLLP